ncbi:MAG: DNA translocase FtsK [bacterium]
MPRKTTAKSKTPSLHIWREAGGIALIALGVLLVLSFISYNPADLLNASRSANYIGIVGAYLAQYLFDFLGVTSYLLPPLVFIGGIAIFQGKETIYTPWRLIGWLAVFLTVSPFIQLIAPQAPITIWGINFQFAGGLTGDFLTKQFLLPNFNREGAYLITVTLFITAFMLVTEFSLYIALRSFLLFLGNLVQSGLENRRERAGERKKRKEQEAVQAAQAAKLLEKEKEPTELKLVKVDKSPEPAELEKKEPEEKPAPTGGIPRRIDTPREKMADKAELAGNLPPGFPARTNFKLPGIDLLDKVEHDQDSDRDEVLIEKAKILHDKLAEFGVRGEVTAYHPGPVITRFEFRPAPGIKINKISTLSDDLALAMKAMSVRIVAPVPGKSVVGIEIPNDQRQTIYLWELIASKRFQQARKASQLTLAVGKDIAGEVYISDLAKMPHLLIAGSTGAGKSVGLNSFILSILFNALPSQVKMVMIDPKMLELGIYNGIPHLLVPTITDAVKASNALANMIKEMTDRYEKLSRFGVRNLAQFNKLMLQKQGADKNDGLFQELPQIIIIIDEFADLMMVAPKEVEGYITRLAQMARAVGIHLIIATQRPSVNVITGLIKANFPSRMSFRVSSKVDSRTILDVMGAEKLLGKGDMLFMGPGAIHQTRLHGAMVTEREVKVIVKFLADQAEPEYDESILEEPEEKSNGKEPIVSLKGGSSDNYDKMYDEAPEFAVQSGEVSVSMIQRRFRIGYNRAANIVEQMERDGIVGPSDGSKPRKVLASGTD